MSSTDKDLLTELERPGQLTPPDRVSYDEGVLLDALDFRAEQSYHRGRLARVLAYLFGTGTAAGLEVVWEKPAAPGADPAFPEGKEERLRLRPGLAVDRLGRLIEVPRDWCIRLDRWYRSREPAEANAAFRADRGTVVADVFLRFLTDERGRTPGFAYGPFDALDASVPSRLRDAFAVELVLRPEADPPRPSGPWADLSAGTPGERRDALHQALLGAWKGGTDSLDDQGRLDPLPEHVPGQDTTSVFLARVSLPAGPAGGDGRPVRQDPLATDVQVDNLIRRFAYPAGALAALQGIRPAGDTP
jgi:hypothetical protein